MQSTSPLKTNLFIFLVVFSKYLTCIPAWESPVVEDIPEDQQGRLNEGHSLANRQFSRSKKSREEGGSRRQESALTSIPII
jgi:hypothetical protein